MTSRPLFIVKQAKGDKGEGHGHETEFEARWRRRLEEARQTARELAAGRLHTAGGGIHYLISGRRPAT